MDNAIELENAGKRYIKYEDVPLLLTKVVRFRAGNRRSHLWAVRGVNAAVRHGESLGVIGRNGSGKSTMFQMLAGVTAPTEGRVRVSGRVAPLISVGIGFHPELTGRENVYVNGTILGLSKAEIDRRFDGIVAFAELADFIDTPVKFYSSGMFVRLGFSVAVASDPEILLVDEVLAVGDVAFQMRCFDRMEEIRLSGATILVVTHSMHAIRRLCSEVMLLHDGRQVFLGDTDDGIAKYHDLLGQAQISERGEDSPEVDIASVELLDSKGRPTTHVDVGEEVTLRAHIHFSKPTKDAMFGIFIHKDSGQEVYAENTAAIPSPDIKAGEQLILEVKLNAALPTGSYTAYVRAIMSRRQDAARARAKPVVFFVAGRPFVRGSADLGAAFKATSLADGKKSWPPAARSRKKK